MNKWLKSLLLDKISSLQHLQVFYYYLFVTMSTGSVKCKSNPIDYSNCPYKKSRVSCFPRMPVFSFSTEAVCVTAILLPGDILPRHGILALY